MIMTPALGFFYGGLVRRKNLVSTIAHWNWGIGGFLKSLGVTDFAGGLVVHTAAGVSAVAAALVIGRRQGIERLDSRPNNIPYVILGASVLWFGWFGFNAGSALKANELAVSALVVTNLAAAGAAVSWMLTDWVRKKKPSAVGIAVGAVCGLVAITPASGYVGPCRPTSSGLSPAAPATSAGAGGGGPPPLTPPR